MPSESARAWIGPRRLPGQDGKRRVAIQNRAVGEVALQLDIPDHVVRKRMANQPGSTPASVEQRLKDYHREMGTVRLYFPNADITTIDGSKKLKVVTKTINALLESRFKK